MPNNLTRSEEIIICKLDELHGNVQATAKALDLTERRVQQVARLHASPVVKVGEEEVILLKPDIERVEGLRSTVSDYLTDTMAEGKMTTREAISLFQIILQYELAQGGKAPGRFTYNDNRTQFAAVIDKLANLEPDQLRALSGQPIVEVMGEQHE